MARNVLADDVVPLEGNGKCI